MLRKDDWKLAYDMQGAGQLYNLTTDPEELVNLFGNGKYLKKQDELLRDLMTRDLRTQDPLPMPRKGGKRQYGYKRIRLIIGHRIKMSLLKICRRI
ncbi:hypothetical protein HK413_08465 [Mucilaginibacter sp. S1162]|uniref:N-sulphoglucosamine sulphohydrolase C-terminal domain-containing protein n=1 Tax=Mucilaginibacter humi TaxID=2732510 RepID=A0ABX1W2U0_9SPHI|nr:hypothetical protein [Mucilaginibacter humi]NNU34169.1 hypothetical protein [Mucilaginibacter humi]